MEGGYSRQPWCSDTIAALRGENPDGVFDVADTSERSRSVCQPFKCMEYQYTCAVRVRTDPIYAEKISSGLAPLAP
jgi:hypothetical protein